MRYGKYLFLKYGDTLKSTRETRHFHRDMTYTVSFCLNTKDGYKVYVSDKKGYDVPLSEMEYEYTAKTVTLLEKRQFEAFVNMFWETCSTFELFLGWDRSIPDKVERNSFIYKLTKSYFLSHQDAIARLNKTQVNASGEGETEQVYFKTKEEFITYLESEISKDRRDYDFKPYQMDWDMCEKMQHLMFLQEHDSKYTQTILSLPETIYSKSTWQDYKDFTFEQFKEYLAELIFDIDFPDELSQEQLELINDIMILYRDLPASHSGTSVSKFLMGKSKIKNQKVEHLFGKYPTILKSAQMFELATRIERFLQQKNIFNTKEEYASGDKWRGTFEFIGSKYINTEELNKLIF